MEQEPFFSVIIPAYNAENFIEEALDSVAKQTFQDYEIVVVDDGSRDGTYEKVRLWKEAHPHIPMKIIRQENRGIGGARNTGVRSARGKYLAFLDADDLWLERKLEVVAQHLDRSPLADLVCHDEWIDNGEKLKKSTLGPYKTYRDLLFKRNCISTSATALRRQAMNQTGWFSEDLRFNSVEDFEFWLRLAKAGTRIEYLHEILGVYRLQGQGITSNITKHIQKSLNVLDCHFATWQPNSMYYRYLMQKRRALNWRQMARGFLHASDYRQAWRYLFLALKGNPLSLKAWCLSTMILLRIKK